MRIQLSIKATVETVASIPSLMPASLAPEIKRQRTTYLERHVMQFGDGKKLDVEQGRSLGRFGADMAPEFFAESLDFDADKRRKKPPSPVK